MDRRAVNERAFGYSWSGETCREWCSGIVRTYASEERYLSLSPFVCIWGVSVVFLIVCLSTETTKERENFQTLLLNKYDNGWPCAIK